MIDGNVGLDDERDSRRRTGASFGLSLMSLQTGPSRRPQNAAALGIAAGTALVLLYEAAVGQMVNRIAEHSRFLSTVAESLSHPFLVIDANHYSIYPANVAALRNAPPGAKTCHAVSHRCDAPCESPDDICPLAGVRRAEKSAVVGHSHYGADGSLRTFEVHAHPVFDENSRVAHRSAGGIRLAMRANGLVHPVRTTIVPSA